VSGIEDNTDKPANWKYINILSLDSFELVIHTNISILLRAASIFSTHRGHICPDHIHMLIEIPLKYAISQVAGCIKGKSAISIART
jgi:hypothetical protein